MNHLERSWQGQQDQVTPPLSLLPFVITYFSTLNVAVRKPTYGELIDIFEDSEQECPNNEELLCFKFHRLYPHIYIGRPRQFYETVSRIVAPTKPSLRGDCKLFGSQLSSYRKRVWEPRIRNLPVPGNSNYSH